VVTWCARDLSISSSNEDILAMLVLNRVHSRSSISSTSMEDGSWKYRDEFVTNRGTACIVYVVYVMYVVHVVVVVIVVYIVVVVYIV